MYIILKMVFKIKKKEKLQSVHSGVDKEVEIALLNVIFANFHGFHRQFVPIGNNIAIQISKTIFTFVSSVL
jgi:hypothetical protein